MHRSYAQYPPSTTRNVVSDDPTHSKQRQSQVTHLYQHAMQRSLIDIDPAENGLTLIDIRDGKTIKPFIPLLTEMSLNANKVLFLCHGRVILFISHIAFSKSWTGL